MTTGEIVAPEAEEVPFSRMVNREMHRAGSCRPCLHLDKQGCDVSLFGSDHGSYYVGVMIYIFSLT